MTLVYILPLLLLLLLIFFWPKIRKKRTSDRAKKEDFNPEYETEPVKDKAKNEQYQNERKE